MPARYGRILVHATAHLVTAMPHDFEQFACALGFKQYEMPIISLPMASYIITTRKVGVTRTNTTVHTSLHHRLCLATTFRWRRRRRLALTWITLARGTRAAAVAHRRREVNVALKRHNHDGTSDVCRVGAHWHMFGDHARAHNKTDGQDFGCCDTTALKHYRITWEKFYKRSCW